MFDGRDSSWHATLALRFHRRDARTLSTNRHQGPLRMQKPLYPEGEAICHAVIIHPPGGIAGGDALEVTATVEPGAHALLTTPGATKWYKANGRAASQRVQLSVSGALEWLPQEAIVFDQADVRSAIDIDLDADAAMIGWDIVALGRRRGGRTIRAGPLRAVDTTSHRRRPRLARAQPHSRRRPAARFSRSDSTGSMSSAACGQQARYSKRWISMNFARSLARRTRTRLSRDSRRGCWSHARSPAQPRPRARRSPPSGARCGRASSACVRNLHGYGPPDSRERRWNSLHARRTSS